MKKRYFLFGEYLVKQYLNLSVEGKNPLTKKQVKMLKNRLNYFDGVLYAHSEEDDILRLLEEFNGWNECVEIPENHFNQLDK